MSSSYITISYHTISRVLLFYLFCWFDLLIWSPSYSILFYFISNWFFLIGFNSIEFDSILLNLIYYILQYCISYKWMICVCLSVYLSVYLFICMNKFFSFLLSHERLPHTYNHTHIHTDTDTNTYEYMFLLMTRTCFYKSG